MKHGLLMTAVALGAVFAAGAAGFELVGAKGAAKIVIPANAEDSTKYAANVLAEYVEKMTGKRLEVVDADFCPRQHVDAVAHRVTQKGDSDSEGRGEASASTGRGEPPRLRDAILIGTLATLGEAVPKDVAAKLKASKQFEASWTGIRDGTLWFVGKETPGEHYAVCHFLDAKCGVRWFATRHDEDPGEYVPKVKVEKVGGGGGGLRFDDFELYREPLFMERRFSMTSAIWYPIPEDSFEVLFRSGFQPCLSIGYPMPEQKAFWNNTNYVYFLRAHLSPHKRRVGGGHNLFNEVAPKKLFDEHPEFFPLVGTNRVWNHLHCFSNTNLLQRVVESTLRKYDSTNGDGQFLFGMADLTRGWCECENCKKLDDPNSAAAKEGRPDISTRFSKAVNYMMPQIYARYPNAEIVRWAYTCYRDLPTGVTHDPRMYFQYCTHGRCHGHTIDDPACERNRPFYKQLQDWVGFSGKGGFLYDYLCSNSDERYGCCEKKEAADIRLYHKLGMVGWKNEFLYEGAHFVKYIRKDPAKLSAANDVQASNWRFYYVVGRLLWDDTIDVDKMLDELNHLYYGPAAGPMCAYQNLRQKLWNSSSTCFGYPLANRRVPELLNDLGAKEQLFKYLDEAEKLVEVESPSRRKVGDVHSPTPTQNTNSIYRRRIAQDRAWLERYWVKPNDKLRSKMGSAFKAPRPISPIVIDGKNDEPAWAQAFYTDAFLLTTKAADAAAKPAIPNALKTSVGILADEANFYLLVSAREPHPDKMSSADGMEFFFFPPAVENTYFQFTVGASGATGVRVNPSGEKLDIPVETKTVVGKDAWTMEVKIPAKRMFDLVLGDTWRINFGRVRGFDDEVSKKASWTIDGTGFHQPAEYRQIEIGEAYLRNGSFEDLNAKGELVGWGGAKPNGKNIALVKHPDGSGQALRLGGLVSQEVSRGPFAPSDKPRKFKYSFRGKGSGKVSVFFFRFTNIPKRHRNDPHGQGGTYAMAKDWKTFSGEYTILPNEWIFIAMRGYDGEVLIDDVQLMPEGSGE